MKTMLRKRKFTKKHNNKKRKSIKKKTRNNKSIRRTRRTRRTRMIRKGGGFFSNIFGSSKLTNLNEKYDPLMKLFNIVLNAKYEDAVCQLNMEACAWTYPFHKTDRPEIERLNQEFNELYNWTMKDNPLNLSDDEKEKANKMKRDIDEKLNGNEYNLLIKKDAHNEKEGYPPYERGFK